MPDFQNPVKPKKLSFDIKTGENKGYVISVRDEDWNERLYVATSEREKNKIIADLSMGKKDLRTKPRLNL